MFDNLNNESINFLLTCIQFENDHNRFPTMQEILEEEGYDYSEYSNEELKSLIQVNDSARLWLVEQGYLEINKQKLH